MWNRVLLLACAMLLLASCESRDAQGDKAQVLNVLAWVGYDEPEFMQPIEKALGMKVNTKTYVGGDQMYSLFRAAPPGTFDIVVVDAEYGRRMFRENLLVPLPDDLWRSPDLLSPFDRGEPVKQGGDVFAAVVRWGALGVVFNRERIAPAKAEDYAVLFDPAVKGRVGIFDWYLPTMGVLSRSLGNARPYDLDEAKLAAVRAALADLGPQVRAMHANTGDVIADLRTGEVWITPGIGEWAAAVLAEQGKPIDWAVPRQGGVMWVEALAIPRDARHRAASEKFIRAVRQPDNLARLAWRRAYHSQMPTKEAYARLSGNQRKLLKATDMGELQQIIDRLAPRALPGPATSETQWLAEWSRFKTGVGQ